MFLFHRRVWYKDRTGGNRQLTPWTGRPDTAATPGHPRRVDGLFSSAGRPLNHVAAQCACADPKLKRTVHIFQ